MLNTIRTIKLKSSNVAIEYHSMWLSPNWYKQLLLLLLLITAYHSHGQHLDKRVVFHLYSPKDMGEITILYFSFCTYNSLQTFNTFQAL